MWSSSPLCDLEPVWTVGGWVLRKLSKMGSSKDIMPCTTRVMREGRGWPWNKQILVHPMPRGPVEVLEAKAPNKLTVPPSPEKE